MDPRLFKLLESHARVDDALRREQRTPSGSWHRVKELKKLKLRIKDLIHRALNRRSPALARAAQR